MDKKLEIFKAGTWTDVNGQRLTFSDAEIQDIVSSYDPALFSAPLVVGHPKLDAPAYGWVSALDIDGDVVTAAPDQVEPQFAEMVNAGRFRKVSASFFPPKYPGNPKPGSWYLRHVGFLGAAAPAVKGLKPASFSDDADGLFTVEFAAPDSESLWVVGRVFRNLRDWFLVKHGPEEADRVIPDYLARDAEQAADRSRQSPTFASPQPEIETQEDLNVDPNKDKRPDESAAEFAQRETTLQTREQHIADREKALADRERKAREADIAAFADELVDGGKLLPREREGLVSFMSGLSGESTVSFAEGDETVEKPAEKWLRGFLKDLPERVDFAERGADDEEEVTAAASFAAPAGYTVDKDKLALHRKATSYAAKHDVDYDTALAAVS